MAKDNIETPESHVEAPEVQTAAPVETPEDSASVETPEAAVEAPEVMREPDRVVMVSLRSDGTPDQSADYEVIGGE
jgi:hypothetical protein